MMMMQAPQTPHAPPPIQANIPERGGWLSALFALRGLGDMLVVFVSMMAYDALGRPNVTIPGAGAMQKALLMVIAVSIVDLIGVAGAWMFKKWGIGLLVVMSALDLLFAIQSGDMFRAILRILVLGAIITAVWPRWRHFE